MCVSSVIGEEVYNKKDTHVLNNEQTFATNPHGIVQRQTVYSILNCYVLFSQLQVIAHYLINCLIIILIHPLAVFVVLGVLDYALCINVQ